jgi:hypothetical protein
MYKSPRQTPKSNKHRRVEHLIDCVIRKHLKPVTICLNELEEWLPYAFRTGRKKEVIEERALFCYLACKHGWMTKEVSNYLGLDHSTVIHHRETVKDQLPYYSGLKRRVESIENVIIH